VVFAADHPKRKQYWVGAGAAYTIFGQKFVPALLDYYLARTGYKSQQTGEKVGPDRPNNLWEPVGGVGGHDHGAHGVFDGKAHEHAPQLFFSHHVREVSAGAAAAGVGGYRCGHRRGSEMVARQLRRASAACSSTIPLPGDLVLY